MTIRVLGVAARSGTVKKIIVTSSVTTFYHIDDSFTDKVYGADGEHFRQLAAFG